MTTYVTVAIPYVNAHPHLGYAYELVLADVYARTRRRAGDAVRFLGGTDDYSLKNVLAAEAAGVPTRRFVDEHGSRFQALAQTLDLAFDDFIRTSADERHAPAVERLWRACAANGDLYKRAYEGDYCVGCEQFYTADDLLGGLCPEHGIPTERVAEENWFFRLSAYQDHLERQVGSRGLVIQPEPFRQEVLGWLRRGVQDFSVSRSVVRARGWGIGVPDDPSQVIYVWFDALTNYISSLRFGDPHSDEYRRWWLESDRRVHVIGKGILRFHALYWPALLASAGQPPPSRIQVHPYLTAGGEKLSKSGRTTVGPARIVADFGTDALRWWFAREVGAVADTDFTIERLIARANEDLANGLGNVTNRVVTLIHRYRGGFVPEVSAEPLDAARDLEGHVRRALVDFDLRRAAQLISDAVTALNRDLEATQPWVIARAEAGGPPAAGRELDALLVRHLLTARAIGSAAMPIVPGLAARVLDQLGNDRRVPQPHSAFLQSNGPDRTPTFTARRRSKNVKAASPPADQGRTHRLPTP
jgi:methionyl-tRNA synthetase